MARSSREKAVTKLAARRQFEACADPGSITARLAKARSAQGRAGAEAEWLERLLAEREHAAAKPGTTADGRAQ